MQEDDKLVKKYFRYPSGRNEYCVTGKRGSISFWYEEASQSAFNITAEKYFGGVECHYNLKSKPDYLKAKSPDHINCMCNAGECWHDGTSYWASKHWIPNIMPFGMERIFDELETTYYEKLYEADNAT